MVQAFDFRNTLDSKGTEYRLALRYRQVSSVKRLHHERILYE